MHAKVKLNDRILRNVACLYITLPLMCFVIGFLRWYFAAGAVIGILYSAYRVFMSSNTLPRFSKPTCISVFGIACVFAGMLIWSYLGGQNGYFYQTSDWDCRNAIFHDLIQFDWPVIYPSTNAALVYYIGHWLPAAVVGKVILFLTGSFRWAWFLGKMALWVWTSLGLMIVVLLAFHFLQVNGSKTRIWVTLLLVLFSGMDVLGALLRGNLSQLLAPESLHLEWWTQFQFSSITTCLFWVFNQTIVPWIITLLFLVESTPQNYVLYGTACLLCGPFPCVGLAICMVVRFGSFLFQSRKAGKCQDVVRAAFSRGNISALLLVFPFVASYILANNAVAAAGSSEIALVQTNFFSWQFWTPELFLFLVLEVGVYILLIFKKYRTEPLFYGLIFIFLICPYFHIGAGKDFCMRVSVPAILILALYVIDFLLDAYQRHRDFPASRARRLEQCCAGILVLCLLIGAVTPVVEIYCGFYHVAVEGTIKLEDDSIMTFNKNEVFLNFNSSNPGEKAFFKYFSK